MMAPALIVGGLAGRNNGAIRASYATGTVGAGGGVAGGLVGYSGVHILASYATGSVSSGGYNAGGLVGTNEGTITANHAAGAVAGGEKNIGGLAGDNGGSIINSYATGSVASPYQHGGGLIGPIYAGGLVGRGDGGSSTTSYWDTETSGRTGSASREEGLTTAELQAPAGATGIYASWNPAWWDFGTSEQYPVLKVQGLSVAAQR